MPFAMAPDNWRDDALARKWDQIRNIRRAVTGALEIERAEKRIGSSLEAAPEVFVAMEGDAMAMLQSIDFAEVCITSGLTLSTGEGPASAFRLDDLKGVAVVPALARGRRCARSWKVSEAVGTDKDFPDITPRDAEAVREWQTRFKKTV
jgi:isoleucyl-tRNA synthetase